MQCAASAFALRSHRKVQIPAGACIAGGRVSPTTAVIDRKRASSPGGSSGCHSVSRFRLLVGWRARCQWKADVPVEHRGEQAGAHPVNSMKHGPVLNPVFHQTLRTRIAALLSVRPYSFSELKNVLDVTDGNLDAHLRKLSSAGYLHSRVVLTERPQTIYDLSPSGKRAFAGYLVALKAIIKIADSRTRLARR